MKLDFERLGILKDQSMHNELTFYEFFAGGGLARLGLGPDWTCLFANDISKTKAQAYRMNFPPAHELLVRDIHQVDANDIPGTATLAWASFPCQDLSLAGNGAGLRAERSGTFWPFWNIVLNLESASRNIPIIVLENVAGLLTSNEGNDFQDLLTVFVDAGYRPGAMVIDAIHFVPQSRPRLFIIAVKADCRIPQNLLASTMHNIWHPSILINAHERLPKRLKDQWVWWDMPYPDTRRISLRDIIEEEPQGVMWHTPDETKRLLSLMSPTNLVKVRQARAMGKVQVGTIYKRTRTQDGQKVQRAEVRFDGISGCLRTPAGGSSRQTILIVDGSSVRSRLLSVREAARLMGLQDSYKLPERYNDGYHVMGDAVVAPVISWLEKNLLRQLAAMANRRAVAGAH
ncbi:MAG: DNA cytosine methyltransferase [Blastocatellia bacterium]